MGANKVAMDGKDATGITGTKGTRGPRRVLVPEMDEAGNSARKGDGALVKNWCIEGNGPNVPCGPGWRDPNVVGFASGNARLEGVFTLAATLIPHTSLTQRGLPISMSHRVWRIHLCQGITFADDATIRESSDVDAERFLGKTSGVVCTPVER
jgi:hypothetical protein